MTRRARVNEAPALLPEEGLIVVVFEWEGRKPPTAFYHHVRRLLWVWKRRAESSRRAFWAQESVFILADEATARLLAALGEEKGCSRVFLIVEGRQGGRSLPHSPLGAPRATALAHAGGSGARIRGGPDARPGDPATCAYRHGHASGAHVDGGRHGRMLDMQKPA